MNVFRAFFTISGLTMVSRVMGFVRDVLMASTLGAGLMAEVFLVAFKLPNFFRRLFAEGAFSAAFVPLYSKELEKEGEKQAHIFASNVMSWMVFLLLSLTILIEIFMPLLVTVIAPGFVDVEVKYELSVELSRITFPYMFLICLVALLGGILNALGKFAAFAAMPIFLNGMLVVALLGGHLFFEEYAFALSYAITAAGVLQLGWMLWRASVYGVRPRLHIPKVTQEVKVLAKKMLPGIFGAGIVQINVLVDVIIATFFSGAIAYLYYADRVMQLPLALVGTALSIALLPMLSKSVAGGNEEQKIFQFKQATFFALMLAIPAAAGLVTLGVPITSMLFERGEFESRDVIATGYAMMAYGIGLPAFIMIKIFSTLFFAHGDTSTPVKVSIAALFANLFMNITFVVLLDALKFHPHVGLAGATSLAAWLQAGLLYYLAVKHNIISADHRVFKGLKELLIACGVMVMTLGMTELFRSVIESESRIITLLQIMVSGALYFVCLRVMGVISLEQFKKAIKSGKPE